MKNRTVNTWELERYLLGELPRARMGEIERALGRDEELRLELEALRNSDKQILARYPAASIVPEIQRRARRIHRDVPFRERFQKRLGKRFLFAVPVLASAVLLLFIVVGKDGKTPWGTRIKGEQDIDYGKTQLLVYRKQDDRIEILDGGDPAATGDLIQIAYVPAGKNYGVIFSIDGGGVLTLHFPENEGDSCRLDQEKATFLASAYELDDAPRFEKFFFVTADNDIDVAAVLESARTLAGSPAAAETGSVELPPGMQQFTFILKKGQ